MQNKWNINKICAIVKGDQEKKLLLVGEFLSAVSKAQTPVDTGFLRGSTYYKMYGPLTVRIGNNAFYAIYVEFGTGEHAENGQGRQGGWFYTDAKGKGHFTHGQKPKPFLRPLLEGYERDILRIMAA